MKRRALSWGGDLHYRHLQTESTAFCVKECLEDQTRCLFAASVKAEGFSYLNCYLYDDVDTKPVENEDGEFFARSCPEGQF